MLHVCKIVISAVLALCLLALPVAAALVVPVEDIDLDRKGTVKVLYTDDGHAFADKQVDLYRIADVDQDWQFTPAGAFADYPVDYRAITNQDEYNALTFTLSGYILRDAIEPTATLVTDEKGIVNFTDLVPGMYLVSAVREYYEEVNYTFESFLVAVPGLNADDTAKYDQQCNPKVSYGTGTKGLVEMSVVLTWDDGGSPLRPDWVEIEIYRNGELFDTVVLSDENDWSYFWTAVDDGAEWTVVQKRVPDGYNVLIQKMGDKFVVVDAYEEPEVPPTGDLVAAFACVSLLTILGGVTVVKKKQKH